MARHGPAAALLVALLAPATAGATPVLVAFQGTTSGGAFTGLVAYESSLADADAAADVGHFVDPLGSLSVTVGGFTYQTGAGPLVIDTQDDERIDLGAVGGGIVYVDSLTARSTSNQPGPGAAVVTQIQLYGDAVALLPPVSLLDSDALPDAATLAAVLIEAELSIDLDGSRAAFGRITTAQVIPEPTTVLLLAGGLLVLGARRRPTRPQDRPW